MHRLQHEVSMEKVLIIRSSEWLRAGHVAVTGRISSGDSMMFNETLNRYCCLGLAAKTCGMPDSCLSGRFGPAGAVFSNDNEIPTAFSEFVIRVEFATDPVVRYASSNTSKLCMAINDRGATTDEQKISRLREVLGSIGWTIDWRPDE